VHCSIITPVHNHWHLVPKLLECLADQTLPQTEFEIVLVENCSDDFRPPDPLPPNARIEHCRTPGSYAARNEGIKHATGTWLAFTDADCRPRPDWLENLMAATEQVNQSTSQPANHLTLFAGAVEMIPQNDPPNRYEIYDLVRGIPQSWYVKRGYAATANLAVSAELMNRLGGFDASRHSGGDAELCRRARKAGAALEYVPNAVAEHPARQSWEELVAKVRRVKHGQVASGARAERWRWRLRTLLPPLIETFKYLRARQWPLSFRLQAIAVQFRLWPVDVHETWRLRDE
jgi:GT2 family glycosyltransferase